MSNNGKPLISEVGTIQGTENGTTLQIIYNFMSVCQCTTYHFQDIYVEEYRETRHANLCMICK